MRTTQSWTEEPRRCRVEKIEPMCIDDELDVIALVDLRARADAGDESWSRGRQRVSFAAFVHGEVDENLRSKGLGHRKRARLSPMSSVSLHRLDP
jgi:hypothetical protein